MVKLKTIFLLVVFVQTTSGAIDYLPDGALGRLGIGRFWGASYSPDGTLLTLSRGSGLSILEAISGKEVGFLRDPRWRVLRSAVFSPDGSTMACIGGGDISWHSSILVWDTSTWELLHTFDGHERPIRLLAFLPEGKSPFSDGETIISQSHEVLRGWDVETGWVLYVEELKGDDTGRWLLSPTLDFLLRSIDGRIEVRDPCLGGILHTLDYQGRAEAFSADGSTLIVFRGSGVITLVDVSTWESKIDIRTGKRINDAVLSSDGSLLAGRVSAYGNWYVWDARTGEKIRTFPETEFPAISLLSFAPDGSHIITSDGEATFLWDLHRDSPFAELPGRLQAVSPDGKTFVSQEQQHWSRNNLVNLCNTDGSLIKAFEYYSGNTDIEFSPDGQILAVLGFGPTLLWDVKNRTKIAVLDDDGLYTGSIAMHPEEKIFVTGRRRCTVQNYSGTLLHHLSGGPKPYTRSLKFSPDGSILAGRGQDPDIHLWETTDWTPTKILPGRDSNHKPRSMDFSPDGRFLATARSRDPLVRLWDTSSWTLVDSLEHEGKVHTVLFSPYGKTLATADRGFVYLWDIVSGDTLATFPTRVSEKSLEFSPDGKTLFGIEGGIVMWDVPDRTEITTLKGDGYPNIITVSPDRKIVASGSDRNKTVHLWNTATQDSIINLRGHSDDINSLKFSPDGELLASSGLDGVVYLWNVPYLVRDHIPTDVQFPRELPYATALLPNYPNPFNPHTEIVYRLATPGTVRLSVYNVLGQPVRTLVNEYQTSGQYHIPWDARNDNGREVGAGTYIVRMDHIGGTDTRRLLHLK